MRKNWCLSSTRRCVNDKLQDLTTRVANIETGLAEMNQLLRGLNSKTTATKSPTGKDISVSILLRWKKHMNMSVLHQGRK